MRDLFIIGWRFYCACPRVAPRFLPFLVAFAGSAASEIESKTEKERKSEQNPREVQHMVHIRVRGRINPSIRKPTAHTHREQAEEKVYFLDLLRLLPEQRGGDTKGRRSDIGREHRPI